jgi:hypothetical protein
MEILGNNGDYGKNKKFWEIMKILGKIGDLRKIGNFGMIIGNFEIYYLENLFIF